MSHVIDDISLLMKQAMKNYDADKLNWCRMLKAALETKATELRPKGKYLTESDIHGVIRSLIKRSLDASVLYHQGGRPELSEKEKLSAQWYQTLLPQEASESEVKEFIEENKGHYTSMGSMMGALKDKFGARLNAKEASILVKSIL